MKEYNRIKKIASVFAAVMCIWVVASFINVNMHNMTDMQYAAWNVFNLF